MLNALYFSFSFHHDMQSTPVSTNAATESHGCSLYHFLIMSKSNQLSELISYTNFDGDSFNWLDLR